MKPVRFTGHAIEKLEIMRSWGFEIDREKIRTGLVQPHESSSGYQGRSIARFQLDAERILRVVYEENGESPGSI